MKYFDWDADKNKKLKIERDIGFEEIVIGIQNGSLIDISDHPNQKKYPGQHICIINIREYVYIVPFVEDDEKVFLKTIIPSRKMTKKFIINKNEK